jgi:hypothetical protein
MLQAVVHRRYRDGVTHLDHAAAVQGVAHQADERAHGDLGRALSTGHDDLEPGVRVYGYLRGSQDIASLKPAAGGRFTCRTGA